MAEQLSKEYRKSSDDTLTPFADRYQTIANELSDLSKTVKTDLTSYNQEINSSSMGIVDASVMDCVSCIAWIVVNAAFDPTCDVCIACAVAGSLIWFIIIGCIAVCGLCILGAVFFRKS